MRKLISEALSRDPAVEVVGVAASGRIALQKMTQVNPDIVTLDVEMDEMDGVATLRELRKIYPGCRSLCLARSPHGARQRRWMR